MTSLTQTNIFDYSDLDAETRIIVQQRTSEIKSLMKRAASDIIEIGQKLIEVKAKLGHDNWTPWLKAEFDWTDQTARNFMHVARAFAGQNQKIFDFAPSALYLLAAPRAPEGARIEAIARAEEGETITHGLARDIVANYKPTRDQWVKDNAEIGLDEFNEPLSHPSLAEWRETDRAKQMFPYTCDTCGDRFGQPVWHCPGCDHHYHVEDDECGNCHEYTSDGKRIEWDNDELDPPMELEQVADQFPDDLTPTDKDLLQTSTPSVSRINAGMYTSATPEWYTPSHIVDRVEKMFGQISLDPCSNSNDWREAAIPAESYWTKEDDGLAQLWNGKVYMNPPYGDEIAAWVERLKEAYESGEITEAIALLPARTDTAWFQTLADYRICFVRGRLKFSQSENSAPFPSAVIYLGADATLFWDYFHDIGFIK